MPRTRIIGIALIVVGAVLLWQGWQIKQSLGSRISEALQGAPSENAMWMLAAGAVAAVVGIVLTLRR